MPGHILAPPPAVLLFEHAAEFENAGDVMAFISIRRIVDPSVNFPEGLAGSLLADIICHPY